MTAAAANASTISVVIVDDHDLLREGVASALSSFDDISVIGGAASGERANDVVAQLRPDVVLIDLVMPGMGGVEAIRVLRSRWPDMGIVALSSFSEGHRVRDAIDAGANGYLTKSVDAASLARAVRSAAVGQGAFSPEVTAALTKRPDRVRSATALLTQREVEIADLVSDGRTNAEIAHQLELSLFTVKNHVSHILAKLGVQSRTEAAAVIFRRRLEEA